MIWPLRKTNSDNHDISDSAIALVDAANLYGAGRHIRGVHNDPNWSFSGQYNKFEDECLFYELLHFLLLYDLLIVDFGSIAREKWQEDMHELEIVLDTINSIAGYDHIKGRLIAPRRELTPVADAVCRLISKSSGDEEFDKIVSSTRIPWYYREHGHFDHPTFLDGFRRYKIDDAKLPFALFLYRGIVYSGYANHYNKTRDAPMAYLASAGRLRALQPVIDSRSQDFFNYPRTEYRDLVDLLDLPTSGYDFSLFSLDASHVSSLSQLVDEKAPTTALSMVYDIRQTGPARDIRGKWADRLWRMSESCVVGAGNSNWISGSTIHGDVTMIHASARS